MSGGSLNRQVGVAYYTHCETAVGPLLVVGDVGRLMAIRFDVEAADLWRAVESVQDALRGRYGLERDDERIAPVVEDDALRGR